jgi:hypothetical protein
MVLGLPRLLRMRLPHRQPGKEASGEGAAFDEDIELNL